MYNDNKDIIIRSEEDAYTILELLADNEVIEYRNIIFDGWPTLNLYIKGEKFEKSLTPTVMKGLIELQKGIYQSYASAKFNNPSKRLSDDERKLLEIKVVVNEGSSDLDINFTDIVTKLIEELGQKLDPTQVLYTVIFISVLYFGNSAYKSYLENRKDIRLREITDEGQKELISALKFTSAQETERTKIIAKLADNHPEIKQIKEIAQDAHTELVKSLGAGDTSRIGDTKLTTEISETLTNNARRVSKEVRLDGKYRLLKIDWSDQLKFKVKVINCDTGFEVDAEVQDDSLTGQHKDALKNAEWSRKPLNLQINAKLLGDDNYHAAVIMSAELIA